MCLMRTLTERKLWRRHPATDARSRPGVLTPSEQDNVRRALRQLRRRFGSHRDLAEALGTTPKSLENALSRSRKPSIALAFQAARAAGVPLEDLLSGAWPAPGACPMCGSVVLVIR